MTKLNEAEIIRRHYSKMGKKARKLSPLTTDEARRRQIKSVASRKANSKRRDVLNEHCGHDDTSIDLTSPTHD